MTAVVHPAEVDTPALAAAKPGDRHGRVRSALRHYPLACLSAAYLVAVVVAALLAPALAGDPERQDLAHVLAGPTGAHWLGTDQLGRDVFDRLLAGARVTLLDVLIATAVFLALGVPLGVAAGYRGGWLDRVVTRFADLLLAMPAIIILLMIVAVFPGNDVVTMIALGVIGCPGLLRIVRGSTLAVRNELYVKSARLSGLNSTSIVRRHIIPRIRGAIIVQTSLFCATALLAESGLSFLGLSRPDTRGPSWGNMIAQASNVMNRNAWLLVPTGGALVLTILSFAVIGDAVRDASVGRAAPPPALLRRRPAPTRVTPGHPPGAVPETTPAIAVLRVEQLTVSLATRDGGHRDGVRLVEDVSFEIAPGETVGIVGESGSGKSITAKAVLGLLPPGVHITHGHATYDRTDLATLGERALNRIRGAGIALIPQDPIGSLDPTFTVGSQLREVIRRHRHHTRRQAQHEAHRLLTLVRLPDPADVLRRHPAELSGGMAQRVVIAMALAGQPKLLVADEPTTALDVTVQAQILDLLHDLQHQLGMALLLITHDFGVVADICDRALVMYAGQLVETADVDTLFTDAAHPYTRALLAANPHAAPIGQPLPAIAGSVPRPGNWPHGCHFERRCAFATADCAQQPVRLFPIEPGRTARCIHIDEVQAHDVSA